MNPIIKKQLEKCRVARIPHYDDNTTELHIMKGSDLTVTPFEVHNCYVIELADYIINPPPDFTLAVNWNGGRVPQSKFYKAEVAQVMGKMVRINGCGYDYHNDRDLDDLWEGWVPQSAIRIVRKLD